MFIKPNAGYNNDTNSLGESTKFHDRNDIITSGDSESENSGSGT